MDRRHIVFVVDDHDAIRSTIRDLLEDEHIDARIFDSAETLIEGLRENHADLVLLDIWLPGIDGVEALASIKAIRPDLPVILMSGHAGIDVAVKGMKAGAVDFLEKPLNLEILLEKLRQHLPGRDIEKSIVKAPGARCRRWQGWACCHSAFVQ